MAGSDNMIDFTGCKVALIHKDQMVCIQRDDTPGLRFAGMWDLPGGGRENNETPAECAHREVYEELRMIIPASSIHYEKVYPAMIDPNQTAYFLAASVTQEQIDSIVFGDEGQGWKLMTIEEFMSLDNAVPDLRQRLADYLSYIEK
ncbi:NUDIX domain-containing protein [bacterium]|nr:MAG: NUDIX domain-containing protein [bacterium]